MTPKEMTGAKGAQADAAGLQGYQAAYQAYLWGQYGVTYNTAAQERQFYSNAYLWADAAYQKLLQAWSLSRVGL
jgi:hypothetical protein